MAMTRDCKSLAFGLRRFESYLQHHIENVLKKRRTRASHRVLPPAPRPFGRAGKVGHRCRANALQASPTSSTTCLDSSVGRAHPW